MKLYLEIIHDSNNFVKVSVDTEDKEKLKNKASEVASAMGWSSYKAILHKCMCDEGGTCESIEVI